VASIELAGTVRVGSARGLRPVTERILARLPGRRALWIVAWALIPWLNAGANLVLDTEGAVWVQSDVLVILNYAALSLAIVISLWGGGRIAERLETLRTSTATLVGGASREHFREVNSVRGPLLGAAATALAFPTTRLVEDDWGTALVRGATWFVIGIALWSFLWTYGRSSSVSIALDASASRRTPLAWTRASGSGRSAAWPSWDYGCCWHGWCPWSSPDFPTCSASPSDYCCLRPASPPSSCHSGGSTVRCSS
jgi:hypothetical protein